MIERTKSNKKRVIAVFHDLDAAEEAVQKLVKAGWAQEHISVLMSNSHTAQEYLASSETKGAEGVVTGGAVGGLLGAIAAGSLALPGVGLIAAGPLFAAAAGLATGGVSGGLLGGLVGLGIPENEAELRSEQLQKGAILLGVEVDDGPGLEKAEEVLEDSDRETYWVLEGRTIE